jgi:hypothetical protein
VSAVIVLLRCPFCQEVHPNLPAAAGSTCEACRGTLQRLDAVRVVRRSAKDPRALERLLARLSWS